MRGIRLRSTRKSVIAILCAACFLTMSIGSFSPQSRRKLGKRGRKRRSSPAQKAPPGRPRPARKPEEDLRRDVRGNDRVDRPRDRSRHRDRDRRREWGRGRGVDDSSSPLTAGRSPID